MNSRLRAALLVGTGMVAGMLLTLSLHAGGSLAQTTKGCQSFAQTGHQVCGRFLDYWQAHGGLAQQGYPLSEPFTETSDLNGKPYTVQYFERAVFELHPENKAPYDVLLSQLGTYLSKEHYTKGFPAAAGAVPFYENRTDAVAALKSYYNAINRKEYDRAYSYFNGAPHPAPDLVSPFQQWVAGYAKTASVTLAVGPATADSGAGNIYSSVPTVVIAQGTDGSTSTFAGCYVLHRVNSGISLNPADELFSIYSAKLTPVPANVPLDTLLAQPCSR